MAYFVREEETLDPQALAALQERKFRAMLREVSGTNAFWQRRLGAAGFDAERDPISKLSPLARGDIDADQRDHPPYGSNLTYAREKYTRLHQTSGTSSGVPIRWLDTPDSWTWWKKCWGIIYRSAGVTDADRLVFPFSFGPFVGFWGAFETAVSLGNFCLPAGGMTTIARLHYLIDNDATIVCCTPTYALRMAEVAASERIDLAGSSVRALIVAGEPGGHIPETRSRIESAWGARVFDHAGMTEIGPWGFECAEDPSGLHIMEIEFLAEVVDPQTLVPVAEGETGELLLTNLGRWGAPLIRYRTGDQVSLIRRRCACGRWFAFAQGGILGRTDDMLLIRGNNVFPSAIEGVLRGIPEVAEFQVEVSTKAAMTELKVRVEPAGSVDTADLCRRVSEAIRDRFHFQPKVESVATGTLPRFEMKAKRIIRTGSRECLDS
jgi:phenylacetate-CoA ligase